jgi:hypothetical protein
MCTVSLIHLPRERALRLAVNRDELRTRAEALPPRVVRLGGRLAVMPVDPQGGGTWVGADEFAPFRVLIVDARQTSVVSGDGRRTSVDAGPTPSEPLLLTSSGLGDAVVERPRRALFAKTIDRDHPTRLQQDAFHAHQWAERPDLSVRMERPDALTVSRTVVELASGRVWMTYAPIDAAAGEVSAVRLDRRAAQVVA